MASLLAELQKLLAELQKQQPADAQVLAESFFFGDCVRWKGWWRVRVAALAHIVTYDTLESLPGGLRMNEPPVPTLILPLVCAWAVVEYPSAMA